MSRSFSLLRDCPVSEFIDVCVIQGEYILSLSSVRTVWASKWCSAD
jgi:hypothetical protein